MSERALLCPHCGAPNKPGATVCEFCELELVPEAPAREWEQDAVNQSSHSASIQGSYPANEQGSYQEEKKDAYEESLRDNPALAQKNKIIAGLLAIFLGGWGIHKFYLGYKKEGFTMIALTLLGNLTFSIVSYAVGLVGLVEGVIYLTTSNEKFNRIYVEGNQPWF